MVQWKVKSYESYAVAFTVYILSYCYGGWESSMHRNHMLKTWSYRSRVGVAATTFYTTEGIHFGQMVFIPWVDFRRHWFSCLWTNSICPVGSVLWAGMKAVMSVELKINNLNQNHLKRFQLGFGIILIGFQLVHFICGVKQSEATAGLCDFSLSSIAKLALNSFAVRRNCKGGYLYKQSIQLWKLICKRQE